MHPALWSAALARTQLARLPEHNRRRNGNLIYLSKELEPLGFHTYLAPEHIERVYFEYIIRLSPQPALPLPWLLQALQAEGCRASLPRYPLVSEQPFFTEGHFESVLRLPEGMQKPVYLPGELQATQQGNQNLIKLPCFPNAEQELLDQYIHAFKKVIRHAEAIRRHCELEGGSASGEDNR